MITCGDNEGLSRVIEIGPCPRQHPRASELHMKRTLMREFQPRRENVIFFNFFLLLHVRRNSEKPKKLWRLWEIIRLTVGMAVAIPAVTAAFAPAITPSAYPWKNKVKITEIYTKKKRRRKIRRRRRCKVSREKWQKEKQSSTIYEQDMIFIHQKAWKDPPCSNGS